MTEGGSSENLAQTSLSLKHNFAWTFAGNVVYAGCQWGMLVVLAKLGTPDMVGQFGLGLAICAPVFMFTNLQLRAAQATDSKREYCFSDYLGLRLITTTLALLVITGIVVVARFRVQTGLVILAVGVAKGFESISDVFYGLCQQRERMDRIAKSMMIKGPLSLAALGLAVYETGSVLWGVVALALAWAAILASYDVRSGTFVLSLAGEALPDTAYQGQVPSVSLKPRWHRKALAKLAWLALPLGFVMMLISLKTNIPRYFIQHYLRERELGIFVALAYVMVGGSLVVNALGQSATPRLAKHYEEGQLWAFRTLLLKLAGIGAVLGGAGIVVAAVAGRPILAALYGAEYAAHAHVFLWLVAAGAIGYVASFLGYGMTAARYFRAQVPLFALVSGASAAACLWLVPADGTRGAAMALILAAIVQAGGSLAVISYALRRRCAEPCER